jgi:hypothetical protein
MDSQSTISTSIDSLTIYFHFSFSGSIALEEFPFHRLGCMKKSQAKGIERLNVVILFERSDKKGEAL